MSFLDTTHKKRSFTLTTALLIGLLLLLFFVGLTYVIPPPETGISINLGTEDTGGGEVQPEAPVKTVDENTPQEQISAESPENVVTGNEEEVPVVKPKNIPKVEKKPSKAATDALSNILNSKESDGRAEQSEGNDNTAGDKGKAEGDPYANSYYGSPGTSGTGVSYGLKGRKLMSSGKVPQECNEEGRVVVKIEVDKNGKVISAVPGVKGTTNNHPCLLEPAKKTALLYRWNLDAGAPSRQIGFVVINFKLGE